MSDATKPHMATRFEQEFFNRSTPILDESGFGSGAGVMPAAMTPQRQQALEEVLRAALPLLERGFFHDSSCADAATNREMRAMRNAIAKACSP